MAEYIYEETKGSDGVRRFTTRGTIVRCRDCMYFHDDVLLDNIGSCVGWQNINNTQPDDYCSRGIRRAKA